MTQPIAFTAAASRTRSPAASTIPKPQGSGSRLDLSKLTIFSVPKRTASAGSGNTIGASRLRGKPLPDPSAHPANATTGQPAAGTAPFAREPSKASSGAVSKRSVSSEDARRIMREKMLRDPDIEPKRGGNANIEKITPEYVTEFWVKKKMEVDEFRRRRLLLVQQKRANGTATSANSAPTDAAGTAVEAPLLSPAPSTASRSTAVSAVAGHRQPLRAAPSLSRAAPLAGKKPVTTTHADPACLDATSSSAAAGSAAIETAVDKANTKLLTRTNGQPMARSTSSPHQVTRGTKTAGVTATSPAGSGQPVARRLLVGSAAVATPAAPKPTVTSQTLLRSPVPVQTALRSLSAPAAPHSKHQASAAAAHAPMSSPSSIVKPSTVSSGGGSSKRVHIQLDPASTHGNGSRHVRPGCSSPERLFEDSSQTPGPKTSLVDAAVSLDEGNVLLSPLSPPEPQPTPEGSFSELTVVLPAALRAPDGSP